ncbi:arsenate reductase [Bacillus oleivorans]|uniref:Arsenate reductase n=1 Tax=Bacillus oleivorans TaxID=1448271 RepID=A0A285CZ87_9BACI|nr:arsenate reductase family protein [Bacillus oleivorans]SNX72388.1 arsenate reductase [Bacillus oleivorans]
MALTFYGYPKCGTCREAAKWLDKHDVPYNYVHIVEETPSKEKIEEMYKNSGLELKKFFNTSGLKYKELGIKDKLKEMSESEQLKLLASDGMLLKRPIATDGKNVTIGFKEDQYEQVWKK